MSECGGGGGGGGGDSGLGSGSGSGETKRTPLQATITPKLL